MSGNEETPSVNAAVIRPDSLLANNVAVKDSKRTWPLLSFRLLLLLSLLPLIMLGTSDNKYNKYQKENAVFEFEFGLPTSKVRYLHKF